uniref:ETS homologous factor n=1 Tax=Lygus hesperus TaxID=30085 RepID=A0A0A9YQZ1_LYGHE
MHTVELHEMMPRNHLIPQTIRHTDNQDLERPEGKSPIEYWTSNDIANWLIRVSDWLKVDFTDLHGEKFVHLSGSTLLNMTESEFTDVTPEFGKSLYEHIKMESSLTPVTSGDYLVQSETIKPVEQWNDSDIADWLVRTSIDIGVDYTELCGEKFVHLTGPEILDMTERDFLTISQEHGKQLFNSIQRGLSSWQNDVHVPPMQTYEDENGSDRENTPSSGLSKPVVPEHSNPPGIVQKRRRGRPSNPNKKGKKKPENSYGRLWEFLRDLLKNPDMCPRIIKWENHDDGLFRFVQSNEVARIWGERKGNKDMTYEKLSRAMRYYYGLKNPNSHCLTANRKRLVYQFGPKATNWRVEDPNFDKRDKTLVLLDSFNDMLNSLSL